MAISTLRKADSQSQSGALGKILTNSALLQAGAWLGGIFQENGDAAVRIPLAVRGFSSRLSDVPIPDWPFGPSGAETDEALRLFVEAGALAECDGALCCTDDGRGLLAAIQLMYQRDRERIWERIPWLTRAAAGKRVLDAGCGLGAYSLLFRDLGAQSVIAMDYSPLRLGTVGQMADACGGGVSPMRSSVEAIPLATGSIDLIFSRVVIPYVHQVRTMQESARVLARGGRALLILHAAKFYWGQLRRFGLRPGLIGERARASLGLAGGAAFSLLGVEPHWKLRKIGFYLSYQTRGAFSRLAERCGLKIDSWESNGDKPIACLSKP